MRHARSALVALLVLLGAVAARHPAAAGDKAIAVLTTPQKFDLVVTQELPDISDRMSELDALPGGSRLALAAHYCCKHRLDTRWYKAFWKTDGRSALWPSGQNVVAVVSGPGRREVVA